MKRRDAADIIVDWGIRLFIVAVLFVATVSMINFLDQGASVLGAIGGTVLVLAMGLVILAGFALYIFAITDGSPPPDWMRHRHCGDWLHGGQCPDPAWHIRTGHTQRHQHPNLGGTSSGAGDGDGF